MPICTASAFFFFMLVEKNRAQRFFFFFNDPATTEIYTSLHTLSLHDALPICVARADAVGHREALPREPQHDREREPPHQGARAARRAAAHHPDERARGARLGVVRAPRTPLPARLEHRRERREPPRALGRDGERDRAPVPRDR